MINLPLRCSFQWCISYFVSWIFHIGWMTEMCFQLFFTYVGRTSEMLMFSFNLQSLCNIMQSLFNIIQSLFNIMQSFCNIMQSLFNLYEISLQFLSNLHPISFRSFCNLHRILIQYSCNFPAISIQASCYDFCSQFCLIRNM